jgi:hypothetical protein
MYSLRLDGGVSEEIRDVNSNPSPSRKEKNPR